MKSMIELCNTIQYNGFVKSEFELFLSNPEEKERVLDSLHEMMGGIGYTFAVENLQRPGGFSAKLTVMKVGNEKNHTFKHNAYRGIINMRMFMCLITKDMGYTLHSSGLQGVNQYYTVLMTRE